MKKLLLYSSLFILHSSLTIAQGVWSPRDTLPDSAMFQGITGFSIGNYGYAGLGENVAGINENYFWQFDPSTDIWARKADFPGSARVAPASFVIGNDAYLVTGSVRNGGLCLTECWQYNSITDAWTQKTSFPGAARTYAVGFAIGSKGYVGTGSYEDVPSEFYKDFYVYDTAGAGSWTRIADFGGFARSGAAGFAVNGKGYVCCGQDSAIVYYGDMWEYDTGSNSWTRRANMPGDSLSPHLVPSGFAICNNIYVGSGIDSIYKWSPEFWKYNTITNTWTQEASVPGPTKVEGAAFAVGDTGYYGFGWDSTGYQIINIFDKFYAGDSCTITTGFRNDTKFTDISIYPNPFNQECSITLPNDFNITPLFSLYSIEGIRQNVDICGNSLNYTLKRNLLSSGVYILSINCNGTVFFKKLIITN